MALCRVLEPEPSWLSWLQAIIAAIASSSSDISSRLFEVDPTIEQHVNNPCIETEKQTEFPCICSRRTPEVSAMPFRKNDREEASNKLVGSSIKRSAVRPMCRTSGMNHTSNPIAHPGARTHLWLLETCAHLLIQNHTMERKKQRKQFLFAGTHSSSTNAMPSTVCRGQQTCLVPLLSDHNPFMLLVSNSFLLLLVRHFLLVAMHLFLIAS